ncbi:GNAT family N-acetyltransferase [Microbacterium sp. NPDC091382]|uniref:GNAT family N-acetyltransferase n=1 Tax=Microbacterium sp. NPDC091382 TaxID=3364210 RepID=UPI003823312E
MSAASTPLPPALADGAVLRSAAPGDEDGILAAIHALAVYEREPDAVRTTIADLTAALFGDDPKVFAHVIERDGGIRAIAVWFLTFSTWTGRHGIWLEDLFVDESDRGRGYGTALLASLAGVALERGYPRLEWTVLDWNAPAVGFYRSIGAEGLEEWTTQRMSGDALASLAAR